ncbi:GNAT family N-acetyltransferase [Babesia caballi]|uniref:GNAT family N-acetyltransferase n=1 Tax=Babesia caballi TaxID=5871 RepID=A0AAV4LZ90_BABCB|nr:GNAT family N-acetyltransferase [Babesia caballi]
MSPLLSLGFTFVLNREPTAGSSASTDLSGLILCFFNGRPFVGESNSEGNEGISPVVAAELQVSSGNSCKQNRQSKRTLAPSQTFLESVAVHGACCGADAQRGRFRCAVSRHPAVAPTFRAGTHVPRTHLPLNGEARLRGAAGRGFRAVEGHVALELEQLHGVLVVEELVHHVGEALQNLAQVDNGLLHLVQDHVDVLVGALLADHQLHDAELLLDRRYLLLHVAQGGGVAALQRLDLEGQGVVYGAVQLVGRPRVRHRRRLRRLPPPAVVAGDVAERPDEVVHAHVAVGNHQHGVVQDDGGDGEQAHEDALEAGVDVGDVVAVGQQLLAVTVGDEPVGADVGHAAAPLHLLQQLLARELVHRQLAAANFDD